MIAIGTQKYLLSLDGVKVTTARIVKSFYLFNASLTQMHIQAQEKTPLEDV